MIRDNPIVPESLATRDFLRNWVKNLDLAGCASIMNTLARHYRKKTRKINIEFRPSERATAHGGQMAVNALAEEFGPFSIREYCEAIFASADS